MEPGIVRCKECGQSYSARIRPNGEVIVPMPDQACGQCGADTFVKVALEDLNSNHNN